MKIAHIVPSPAITGPVTVAHELVQMLAGSVRSDIFYFDQKDGYHWPTGRRIPFFTRPRFWSEYQILHTHTLRPDLYSALQKFLQPKVKTVTTLHNFFYHEYRIEYPLIPALAGISAHHISLLNKDALVAITPEMRNFYQRKGFRRISYIPNTRTLPTPTDQTRQLSNQILDWKADKPLLMSIGTVNERKNLFTLIPLLQANPYWKWIHIGSGHLYNKLTEAITRHHLHTHVLLPGHVPNGSALLHLADVLVLPSLSEGFPLVVLEAFQAHVPVVVSDIPAFRGLFTSEVIRCNPTDVANFTQAIYTALSKKAFLTENAYKIYQTRFSPQEVSAAYLSLYESLH